jgi:hypothetical protein
MKLESLATVGRDSKVGRKALATGSRKFLESIHFLCHLLNIVNPHILFHCNYIRSPNKAPPGAAPAGELPTQHSIWRF